MSTSTLAPPVTEAAFQRTIVALFRLHQWRIWHNQVAWRSEAGWPDLVAVHPDPARGVVFLEIKTDTGKLTAAQEGWIFDLTRAGARCHVLRPRDWELARAIARGEV
jgi:hypothetical protein